MEKTQLIWCGQSFFKIITGGGKVILIDPWKDSPPSNNLFPKDVPIEDADIILVTHGHLDHLGDTVSLAKSADAKKNLKVFSIFEIMIYLLEQGVPQEKLQAMNKGGSVKADDITITMVNAVHSSGIGAFGPKTLVNGGEAAGFVITLEDGRKIYHAGDTDVFGDMELIREMHNPDVVLLPIGGIFTMGPKEAARAVSMLRPKVAIPMHYGGTFGLPGSPEDFKKAVTETASSDVAVNVPKPGEVVGI